MTRHFAPDGDDHAQIEDAHFEEIHQGAEGQKTSASAARHLAQMPRLDYMPGLRQRAPGVLEVVAQRDDEGVGSWGIWGALLALVLLVGFLTLQGTNFFDLRDILIAVLLAGLAVGLWRWGPRGGQRSVTLVTVDTQRGQVLWSLRRGRGEVAVSMESVSEVVFAMTRAPVSLHKPDAHIQVYALLLRQGQSPDLMSVIEASPDQQRVFAIAQQFAALMQAPLTQVGEGVREP